MYSIFIYLLIYLCLLLRFRLTADVQDFKSSFKMVVSQGMRSVTQVSHLSIYKNSFNSISE